MYEDFEDLRDNCPSRIKAQVAIDFHHPEQQKLQEFWPQTTDGEFRLSLVQRVSDFFEREVRQRGGDLVPEDGFAIEILLDSYQDEDMGHSLYLEMHAYCGTDNIGDLAWQVLADDDLEKEFSKVIPGRIADLLGRLAPGSGITCTAEVNEVEEL